MRELFTPEQKLDIEARMQVLLHEILGMTDLTQEVHFKLVIEGRNKGSIIVNRGDAILKGVDYGEVLVNGKSIAGTTKKAPGQIDPGASKP